MTSKYTSEDIDNRLQTVLDSDYTFDRNKELLQDLLDHLRADGNLSNRRAVKYVAVFKAMFKNNFIDTDLDEATVKDVRRMVGKIRSSDYSDYYQHDMLYSIRAIYKRRHPHQVDRRTSVCLDHDYPHAGVR